MGIPQINKFMNKGFMMKSNDFKVTSTQTSDPQQEAETYGQKDAVVKPSATDQMSGGHKAKYFSK